MALQREALRHGRVRGRYFRENFAQGGIDLVQVVPELVTNADAAIAAGGRGHGRIWLSIGPPDPAFLARWRAELRRLRAPALRVWKHEVVCTDDGEGVSAEVVDRRLGALGERPALEDQRGLFGRGLRDVWLAQGAGRIEGVREGRLVETWFFPAAGDEPYAYVHVRDEPAARSARLALGLDGSGARVTVPLAQPRVPPPGRLRTLVSQLVQLRPILEDPQRELWLSIAEESPQLVTYPAPEPDPERPLVFDDHVEVARGIRARIVVRLAAEPFTLGPSRATRRGGLVVRSGRAAHEATLAGHEGRPGARHLYGEVRCDAIERLQRQALDSPRPQVVVRVDRSGLNEPHPVVQRLYAAIDRVLRPIVADEERRAGARLVAPGKEIRARDQQGMRALNDALRSAFESPGTAPVTPGGGPTEQPPVETPERQSNGAGPAEHEPPPPAEPPALGMRFKQSPLRLHPGERRGTSLMFDPQRVPPGTPVSIEADACLGSRPAGETAPDPSAPPWARLAVDLRARASVEPGSRLSVLAEAGDEAAELEVVVVRHTGSGWVREIARKDEDAPLEAQFDPESGVVTVYEGRREFRALERAARRGGISARRVREYLPYRMLEVEVAANSVYQWAAERIVERRQAELGRTASSADYARAVHLEAQALRHRSHERL